MEYSGQNNVGDFVTYRCDSGYALIGDSTRFCQEDGQWTGSEPSCEGQSEFTSQMICDAWSMLCYAAGRAELFSLPQ